jgi:HSP20 family molecular chaperone IbpA
LLSAQRLSGSGLLEGAKLDAITARYRNGVLDLFFPLARKIALRKVSIYIERKA